MKPKIQLYVITALLWSLHPSYQYRYYVGRKIVVNHFFFFCTVSLLLINDTFFTIIPIMIAVSGENQFFLYRTTKKEKQILDVCVWKLGKTCMFC